MAKYKEVLELSNQRILSGASFLPLSEVDSYTLNDIVGYLKQSEGVFHIKFDAPNYRRNNREYLDGAGVTLGRRAMIAFACFDNEDTLRALPLVAGPFAEIKDQHWDIWNDCWEHDIAEDSENMYISHSPDYAEAVIFRVGENDNRLGLRRGDLGDDHLDALRVATCEMPEITFHINNGLAQTVLKNGLQTEVRCYE